MRVTFVLFQLQIVFKKQDKNCDKGVEKGAFQHINNNSNCDDLHDQFNIANTRFVFGEKERD